MNRSNLHFIKIFCFLLILGYSQKSISQTLSNALVDETSSPDESSYRCFKTGSDATRHTDTTNTAVAKESSTLSSQDFETLNVRFYPNPVSTRLSIEAKGVTISEVSIYDLTGKLVKTSQNTQINVSELSSGAYIIRLTDDSGRVMARKLIKD